MFYAFNMDQDSRPVEEYSVSHIPGSKQVDHEAEEPWKDIDFKNTDKGNI